MRVLIVKTSSMGDVIHTLPAITDAYNAYPDIQFDWLVEENFKEVPTWHPAVKKVIPIAFRRWRKNLFSKQTFLEWRAFRKSLAEVNYDVVIDAQGLIKSALFARLAKGPRKGFNWHSAREHLASLFYNSRYFVARNDHAVSRLRNLFSQIFNYKLPATLANYGVDKNIFIKTPSHKPYLIFLHGTTWVTKHWPQQYWIDLAKLAHEAGLEVRIPWGNAFEKERADTIASQCGNACVLPSLNLLGMAEQLAGASAVVSVDTGLGHLAAALNVPTVSLYGPTNPDLTGAIGRSQVHLTTTFPCSPCLSRECTFQSEAGTHSEPACFATLNPLTVWSAVSALLQTKLSPLMSP